jgi:hypothetical protein
VVVISKNEPRMKAIKLSEVCFFNELPVLLGCSKSHVDNLTAPPNSKNGEWFKKQKFPRPFYVSPSGIRVWWVRDVHRWALGLREKRTGTRKGRAIPMLDDPQGVTDLLGL